MKKLTIAKSIKQTKENPTKNRRKLDDTLSHSKKQLHEGWNGCDGSARRYRKIYAHSLKLKPFNFLLEELKVHDPNVIILGPGKGEDSHLFKAELEDIEVNIHLDTLGFSKTVHKELIKDKIIKKDYSPNISKGLAFEHINTKEHPKLTKAIIGKYHLVVA